MKKVLGVACVFVLVLGTVGPVSSKIYFKKTDTGTLKITDQPIDDSFRLIMKSKIPEDYDMPSVQQLRTYVSKASEKHSIPKTLIYAVIRIESDGEQTAVSHEGAAGLMQLMPTTARSMGVKDPYDPKQNIMGGAKYLKKMLNRFNGDLTKSLAAYNAGPGNVEKYAGIPPYEETRRFVNRVRAAFKQFRRESDMIYTYYDERGVLHVTNIH